MTPQKPAPLFSVLSRPRSRTRAGSADLLSTDSAQVSERKGNHSPAPAPTTVNLLGMSLIPPQTSFARAVVMGNGNPAASAAMTAPMSGLSVLLNQQLQPNEANEAADSSPNSACEADSASGPPPDDDRLFSPLGSSAPGHLGQTRLSQNNSLGMITNSLSRRASGGPAVRKTSMDSSTLRVNPEALNATENPSDRVRRYV
jgi:hypothetical protein